MSAVKANKVQIGQSATAANNITIETPAVPDGSFKVRRGAHDGTGVTLFQVDTAGVPSFPQQAPRTWQVVTRAKDTDYTNNTGRDIELSLNYTSTSGVLTITVGGVAVAASGGAAAGDFNVGCTIPAGAVYRISGTPTLNSSRELRP